MSKKEVQVVELGKVTSLTLGMAGYNFEGIWGTQVRMTIQTKR